MKVIVALSEADAITFLVVLAHLNKQSTSRSYIYASIDFPRYIPISATTFRALSANDVRRLSTYFSILGSANKRQHTGMRM